MSVTESICMYIYESVYTVYIWKYESIAKLKEITRKLHAANETRSNISNIKYQFSQDNCRYFISLLVH